jgi:hypothetical protein
MLPDSCSFDGHLEYVFCDIEKEVSKKTLIILYPVL